MPAGKATLVSAASAVLLAVTLGLTSARPGAGFEVTALAIVLWYALNLVVAVAYVMGRWPALRGLALLPLLVLLSGIPGIGGVRIAERRVTDQRFGRHLHDLQSTVDRLELLPGNMARLGPGDLPESTRTCCYRAFVRRDSVDQLSAVFLVRRQLAYLYDPQGAAMRRGLSRRWRQQELVAPNWYRLVR